MASTNNDYYDQEIEAIKSILVNLGESDQTLSILQRDGKRIVFFIGLILHAWQESKLALTETVTVGMIVAGTTAFPLMRMVAGALALGFLLLCLAKDLTIKTSALRSGVLAVGDVLMISNNFGLGISVVLAHLIVSQVSLHSRSVKHKRGSLQSALNRQS